MAAGNIDLFKIVFLVPPVDTPSAVCNADGSKDLIHVVGRIDRIERHIEFIPEKKEYPQANNGDTHTIVQNGSHIRYLLLFPFFIILNHVKCFRERQIIEFYGSSVIKVTGNT
jgi:hypothetical protein